MKHRTHRAERKAPWRERRLYQYPCGKCGRPTGTVKKGRARQLLCRACRGSLVNENQLELFPAPVEPAEFENFETKDA